MTSLDIEELRELIEEDLKWRNDEVAFLNNLINNINESTLEKTEEKKLFIEKVYFLIYMQILKGFFVSQWKYMLKH